MNAFVLLLVMDSFSHSLSGYVKEYCKKKGYVVIEAVSPYTYYGLKSRGAEIPPELCTPEPGHEINWIDSMLPENTHIACCISESDAGVPAAERISVALHLPTNGISDHLRNKFTMNVWLKQAGLNTASQYISDNWDNIKNLILNDKLLTDSKQGFQCVVKPYRGVASDGVSLCTSIEETENVFKELLHKPKYGGGKLDKVLVQEYIEGDEYAIDTVSSGGETKIVAVWKYTKLPKNKAPFVYQCSELVDGVDPHGNLLPVCQYCLQALDVLKVSWGPTHTEIKMTKNGPKMIEVNARWHAQDFVPITRRCLGYDALVATIDAYFDPDDFEKLPSYPKPRHRYGTIVHLISVVEGTISKINHIEEIKKLASFVAIELSYEIGDNIVLTTDIRTDSGYVLLVHDSDEVLQAEFRKVCELQYTIFEVDDLAPI